MDKLNPHSFWGVVVTPDQTVTLEPLDDYYTIITGAVLAEYDQSNINKSSTLSATVYTTVIDKIDPNKESDPETVTQSNFGYFIPEKIEQVKMNHFFSPLSKVELKVVGPHAIHVSGKYTRVDVDEEEEDIPDLDDSDENLNDEELMDKIMHKYIRNPKGKDDDDNKE